MNFTTALFLFLFLPFFFFVYLIAQPRWRPALGVLASVLFYAWGSIPNLVLIVILLLVTYWVGGRWQTKPARWLIPIGVLVNIGVLAFYKLFFAYGMGIFLGLGQFITGAAFEMLNALTFPMGLSYVSFQLIAYLLDVQKGAVKPTRNLLAFAFYVLLFPKLLVGPIVRYRAVETQLLEPQPKPDQIAAGIRRFLQGFAKKILIADVLAKTVNAVFDLPLEALTSTFAWLGLIGFALQIYFDFSGYTDMAIGLARMLGLEFVENFNFPYIAQSIGDFWRRWHISLSTWFRDYVFYPLERRRLPVIGQALNILIVFLLTGLWHGVGGSFIAWGLLHGLFIAIEGLFLNRILQKLPQPARHIYTLTILLFTWLIFRAPSLTYVWGFLGILFAPSTSTLVLPFPDTTPLPFIEPTFLMAMLAGILLSLPMASSLQKRLGSSFAFTIVSDVALFALFILALGMMASSSFLPGIYEAF